MNDWTWRHVYAAEEAMEEMARLWAEDPDPSLQDLLKQCGRSLFLLESSDWQFLISTFSARDYAELRLTMHNDDFRRLAAMTRRYAEARQCPPKTGISCTCAGSGMTSSRISTPGGGRRWSFRRWRLTE